MEREGGKGLSTFSHILRRDRKNKTKSGACELA